MEGSSAGLRWSHGLGKAEVKPKEGQNSEATTLKTTVDHG